MTLTDEQRKLLTVEVLGECWEEMSAGVVQFNKFGMPYTSIPNRTFDNDADMMALFRKLVDNDEFRKFRYDTWLKGETVNAQNPITEWLFYDPERFCCLVAEWWEVKK